MHAGLRPVFDGSGFLGTIVLRLFLDFLVQCPHIILPLVSWTFGLCKPSARDDKFGRATLLSVGVVLPARYRTRVDCT